MATKVLTLATALLLLFPPAVFAAEVREWRFQADLDGKPIGEHTFTLTETQSGKSLLSEAEFKVKFLFFTAYTYWHQAKERWSADCLQELKSETKENSEVQQVVGQLGSEGFILTGPNGRVSLDSCPMTFAYWNPNILSKQKLLNPQTGEWLDVKVEQLGSEKVAVKGKLLVVDKYRITAPKTEIELWYTTDDKSWVGLRSKTPEGYTVSYKLI